MPIDSLIIEFDRTIYDTNQLKHSLANALTAYGVTPADFWRTYPQARVKSGAAERPYYGLNQHVELLTDCLSCAPEIALKQLLEVLSNGRRFLFPDTLDFLNRMVSLNVKMTLVSYGVPEFVRKKVSGAGVEPFFTSIFYTEGKRQEAVGKILQGGESRVFIISDKINEMKEVAENFPQMVPILKRRPEIPLLTYRETGLLNFDNLRAIQDYLTIIHAMSYV